MNLFKIRLLTIFWTAALFFISMFSLSLYLNPAYLVYVSSNAAKILGIQIVIADTPPIDGGGDGGFGDSAPSGDVGNGGAGPGCCP